MRNTIVYLIGYRGIGKYTIAKTLAGLTEAVLVDNYLINTPVFSVLGASGNTLLPAEIWPRIEHIRQIVLDTIAELAKPEASFLFTNELYEGKSRDRRWYEDVASLASKREALFVPVLLHCAPEENDRRVASAERATRFKDTHPDLVREQSRTNQLLRIDHPNRLELDITHLSPGEAAQAILLHAEQARVASSGGHNC